MATSFKLIKGQKLNRLYLIALNIINKSQFNLIYLFDFQTCCMKCLIVFFLSSHFELLKNPVSNYMLIADI